MKRCLSFVCMGLVSSGLFADNAVIPLLDRSPIVLDGVISPGEYDRATVIEGMQSAVTCRMVPRSVELQLAATGEGLHIAMRTPVEESDVGGGLIAAAREDGDVAVCRDDDIEFLVASPDGKSIYHILFNSRNLRFELAVKDGKKDLSWRSGARVGGRVSDGNWTLEALIPWKGMPGIEPSSFAFNAARNFVRSGLGYGNLTGQKDTYAVKSMFKVRAVPGFDGFRFLGLDARSLASGRVCVRRDGGSGDGNAEVTLSAYAGPQKLETLKKFSIGERAEAPQDDRLKHLLVNVDDPKLGRFCYRRILRFETGLALDGGPITEKRTIPGLGGCSYVRFYPGANMLSVIVDALDENAKQPTVEVVSPKGTKCRGTLAWKPSGRTWEGSVRLPPEARREPGEWKGSLTVDGRRYDGAFGFTERKFPWQGNKLGVSNRILPPFTAIESEGRTLKTVLRTHTLGADGLLEQAKAKDADIFAAPMGFELTTGGKAYAVTDARLNVFERLPFRVRSESVGRMGDWTYVATNIWDYDGFSLMQVRILPPADAKSVARLTLRAPLKDAEARLLHAMVDMPRGNPAGDIPSGSGTVWDSSAVPRRPGKNGLPVIPGEFTPYLWFGGEERGLCLAFDSPRGFDLEDGKPMIRLVRSAGRVTAECDIISRDSGRPHPIVFTFAYQVTPVKPRLPGSERWVFMSGSRLPGMLHINPVERAESFGLFPIHFAKVPFQNDYSYARAFHKAIERRQAPYDQVMFFRTNHMEAVRRWAEEHETYLRGTSAKNVRIKLADVERMIGDNVARTALTIDRALPYTCPSIIPVDDEAYRYYKAEWTTFRPYNEGVNERVYLRQSYLDYLVWTYDRLLENGADGIYFDEMYIIGQTNPDLSPVRDYKRRLIPETGFFAMRQLTKRVANLAFTRKKGELLQCIHYTNMLLIPAFSFSTIGLNWEYHIPGNFQDQLKTDYIRAISTGRQAGFVTVPLLLPHIADRLKMKVGDYLDLKDRRIRTGLALAIQHEMYPHRNYWGRFTEEYRCRYVPWAFGTHLEGCAFLPYWEKDRPFAAGGNFLIGGYRRGKCLLLALSNLGAAAESEVTVDVARLGLPPDAVLMDAMTGERFPLGRAKVPVAECDYRWLYAGAPEFGATLRPPQPDKGFER